MAFDLGAKVHFPITLCTAAIKGAFQVRNLEFQSLDI